MAHTANRRTQGIGGINYQYFRYLKVRLKISQSAGPQNILNLLGNNADHADYANDEDAADSYSGAMTGRKCNQMTWTLLQNTCLQRK